MAINQPALLPLTQTKEKKLLPNSPSTTPTKKPSTIKSEIAPPSLSRTSQHLLLPGPNGTPKSITHLPWSPKQAPNWKKGLPHPSTRLLGEPTKEKAVNHPNGSRTVEEEDLPQEELETAEEEATRQLAHHPEETQSLPGLTYPPTYDLSPAPTISNQWTNS